MPSPKPPTPSPASAEQRQLQLFLERAAPIVLENPVLTAARWEQLASIAHDLDLTADQLRSTIDELLQRGVIKTTDARPPKPPPLPAQALRPVSSSRDTTLDDLPEVDFSLAPPAPPPEKQSPKPIPENTIANRPPPDVDSTPGRWRVEGEPPPLPPPPPKKPHEIFMDFAGQTLAAIKDGVVKREVEQRLIAHASRVLGLSTVYSRHLLLDLVTERKLRLASADEVRAESNSVPLPKSADPRIVDFLKAAEPILAQHHGFNARSRVFLNALARERGLTDAEVEQAMATLAPPKPPPSVDRVIEERLPPFREHVAAQLKRLTGGMLTPATHDKLLILGHDAYGLPTEIARETLRDVSDEQRIPVITQEQAEQHLAELLADFCDGATKATKELRERVLNEGTQWGLTPARVDGMLNDRFRQNRRQQESEQFVTWLGLGGAGVMVLTVIGFFAWSSTAGRATKPNPSPAVMTKSSSPTPAATAPPSPPRETSWLEAHGDLAIMVAVARSEWPTLRKALRDLEANAPAPRDSAYQTLVDHFFLPVTEEARRQSLSDLLSECLAAEPNEATFQRLLKALLRDIPDSAADFSFLPTTLVSQIWGTRTVAAALPRIDKTHGDRVLAVVTALHRATGVSASAKLSAEETKRQCVRGLIERSYRAFIAAVTTGPITNATEFHATLAQEASRIVEPGASDKLSAEFVVAALTHESDSWRQYEELLRLLAKSPEPLAVLKLIELFEETKHAELQPFLGQLLRQRAGTLPTDASVEDIATRVRSALGLIVASDPDGQFTKLSREAQRVLAESTAPPEQTDRVLAEVVRLVHFTTLVCASAQNESGNTTMLELRKAGPRNPTLAPTTSDPADPSGFGLPEVATSLDAETLEALRITLAALYARRATPTDRVAALERLATIASRVPDLSPEAAAALANYLLGSKSGAEHDRVLDHIESLLNWNQLVIALADRLEDASLSQMQLQTLLTRLIGRDVTLEEGKKEQVAAQRAELMRLVLRRLRAPVARVERADTTGDRAAALIAEYYEHQVRLLGMTFPDLGKSGTPTTVLRALIENLSSHLTSTTLSESAQKQIARLPHDLAVAEYVTTNGIQQTVLLERIWLRLLAIEAGRRNSDQTADALRIVEDLTTSDQSATHALGQLRDGHAAQLRLWLLIGKRS